MDPHKVDWLAYRRDHHHPSAERVVMRAQDQGLRALADIGRTRTKARTYDFRLHCWVAEAKEIPPPPKPRAKSAQPFHDAASLEIWEVFDSQTGVRLWTVTGNRETATREAGRLARGQGGSLSDVTLRQKL